MDKKIIGYENFMGVYTFTSFNYFMFKMEEVKIFAPELETELSELYHLFSQNIDKDKKYKLLQGFTR